MPAAAVAFYALIVEDDPSTSDFVTKAIRRKGFDSEVVRSVGEALLQVEHEWPHAVILDLRLPDADGTVLLRRLRRDPRKTRIAVVTGVADPSQHIGLSQFPPDVLFPKPVDLNALVAWLEDARDDYERFSGAP